MTSSSSLNNLQSLLLPPPPLTTATTTLTPLQHSLQRRYLSYDNNDDDDDNFNTLFPDVGGSSMYLGEGGGEGGNLDPKGRRRKKKGRKSSSRYRFVDRLRIQARGGTGGKGSLSVQSIGVGRKVRPDGGHGGDGGSVIIYADPSEQTLQVSGPHVAAQDGTNGKDRDKFGRKGRNKIIRVPCGVTVKRILNYDER